MTSKLFAELGLSDEILRAIDRLGFEQASPIQAEAIPVLREGRDVVGQSQTGSGKTAAFGIPAIEKVDPAKREVQVLILCPTRELAVQVSEEIHKLAFFKKGVHALPIYGGQSYDRQLYGLKQGAHIVIGTPGRVMDHIDRGTLRLDKVGTVILDEADVMLDMGFRDDIEFILKRVPEERQTVFFSATMPRAIQELIQRYARDPVQVRIEQKTVTVPTVEQMYYEVDRRFKIELLTRLIDIHDFKVGIVFCNTKRMVDDLVDHLNAQGYSADRLHGDMSQGMRDRVMGKFRKSGLEFLVATDVAARGIDVDDVQVVFNYDLPYDVEDYVHRIGRTGRAGRAGLAISFVSGRELFQIRLIERYTNKKIERAKIPSLTEVEQARASVFLGKIRTTLQSGEYKKQDQLIEILLEEGFTSTDIASALIHHLQEGEGSGRSQQEEPQEQPDRRSGRDRGEGGRGERRDDRPPRRDFREERGPRGDRSYDRPSPRGREERGFRSERGDGRPPRRDFSEQRREGTAPPDARKPRETRERKEPARESQGAERAQPEKPEKAETPEQKPAIAETAEKVRPLPFPERRPVKETPAAKPAKPSRKTPEGQTRLWMSVGEEMGVTREDIARAIMGETGLPASILGHVDIRDRHLFVDVPAEHANAITSKLKRSNIKGHRLKVKAA